MYETQSSHVKQKQYFISQSINQDENSMAMHNHRPKNAYEILSVTIINVNLTA